MVGDVGAVVAGVTRFARVGCKVGGRWYADRRSFALDHNHDCFHVGIYGRGGVKENERRPMIGLPDFVWMAIVALLLVGNLLCAAAFFSQMRFGSAIASLLYTVVFVVLLSYVSELNREGTIELYVAIAAMIPLLILPIRRSADVDTAVDGHSKNRADKEVRP